jgi:CRP-like cAMP-binding protein
MLKNIDSEMITDVSEVFYPTEARTGTQCAFRKGDVVFAEGDTARGVFIVKTGRVKLSTCLSDGRIVVLFIAGAGSILGINGVICTTEYEVTAEAIEQTFTEFIRADRAIARLKIDTSFAFRVADEMARRYRSAHALVCTLAKSDPILVKLARLLTEWLAETGSQELDNLLTHQQIAEMLATTRETVTRAFMHMRECGILTLKGHSLAVHDIGRLQALAGDCDIPHRL